MFGRIWTHGSLISSSYHSLSCETTSFPQSVFDYGKNEPKSGILQLLKNRSFLLLALLYGTTSGVFGGWSSVLDQNLQGFGIGQTFAGWLGFIAIVSGAFSGVFFSM
jgi:hypothetical protein